MATTWSSTRIRLISNLSRSFRVAVHEKPSSVHTMGLLVSVQFVSLIHLFQNYHTGLGIVSALHLTLFFQIESWSNASALSKASRIFRNCNTSPSGPNLAQDGNCIFVVNFSYFKKIDLSQFWDGLCRFLTGRVEFPSS